MAKDMNVSVTSMRTIVKNDFRLFPYKMRENKYLTPAQKHKRLVRVRFLLGKLKAGTAQRENTFSDEKLFTIEATVHNQNDRDYAKSSGDIDDSVRTVFRRQSSLHSWCGLHSPNFVNRL